MGGISCVGTFGSLDVAWSTFDPALEGALDETNKHGSVAKTLFMTKASAQNGEDRSQVELEIGYMIHIYEQMHSLPFDLKPPYSNSDLSTGVYDSSILYIWHI